MLNLKIEQIIKACDITTALIGFSFAIDIFTDKDKFSNISLLVMAILFLSSCALRGIKAAQDVEK